ncbi:MAG: hypothetical protein PVH29_05130 [Candidatus Zixiibacteriota bacterium]|jgi:hypothetical protein
MAEKKPKKKSNIEVVVPQKPPAQPANFFVVSYAEDDFALDALYVHPADMHASKQDPEAKNVVGNMVARLAFSYHKALDLRKKLDDMITSYEEKKK